MPSKRSAREDAETSKPRQLRKRLRKAEDQLADAALKRDRAQARFEALSIIADEVRSQLADAESTAEKEAEARQPAGESGEKPASGKPASAKRQAGIKGAPTKPARPKRVPTSRKAPAPKHAIDTTAETPPQP